MIGTNRDLKSMQRILDCRIVELSQIASAEPEQAWVSDRLTGLGRQLITISAVLANRRIESAKKVVEFSRWLTGNGVLRSAVDRVEYAPATALQRHGFDLDHRTPSRD